MIVFKKAADLRRHISLLKEENKTVGFVPTMGALHHGHLSLIEASKDQCDVTVCSIFVNPTQFNDPKDFEKYPITIEQDIQLLTQKDTDILFLPSVDEIYPEGVHHLANYDLGALETVLEGKYRPNHFQGVCQVMDRLLHIVQAEKLFMGRKDYQQCLVISKLIELKAIPTSISIQPTIREEDGLAMSSRNVRLSETGRTKAVALHQALLYIAEQRSNKSVPMLIEEGTNRLLQAGFEKVDYIAIANPVTLQPVEAWDESTDGTVLAAAFIDGVRLIDNIPITA